MATYTKIGRIRPDYADVWDSARSYTALEMVRSADGYHAYIAKQDVPAGTPLTDADYWGAVLDVSGPIAESEAAAARANAAAQAADAAREGIQGDLGAIHDALRGRGNAIVCAAEGEVTALTDSSDDPLRGLRIFGKTAQDGTPTPESPVPLVSVGEEGSIGVEVCGKNLLPPYKANTVTYNGITFVSDGKGNIVANGTATATVVFEMMASAPKYLIDGHTYWLSGCKGGSASTYKLDIMNICTCYDGPSSFKYDSENGFILRIVVYANVTLNYLNFCPMIANLESTEYEPYKAQTLTALTPNGLPGIPVSIGGNYTDAEGQQWVCDEVDFERGVYVQRIGSKDMGALSWELSGGYNSRFQAEVSNINQVSSDSGDILCVKYFFDTSYADKRIFHYANRVYVNDSAYTAAADFKTSLSGTTLLHILAAPIETPLTAEEITAYRALHTNKPNTTVFNDAGAHMAVEYNTDAKTYIDNKFAELAAALVNGNA